MLAVASGSAHEAVGRAGFKDPLGIEIETEFYAGKRGYLHGGLGVIAPLNEKQKIGIVGHFVREETGGEIFPSLGAEFIHDFGSGFELEAFSFGYFPVEKQSAWAAACVAVGALTSATMFPSRRFLALPTRASALSTRRPNHP